MLSLTVSFPRSRISLINLLASISPFIIASNPDERRLMCFILLSLGDFSILIKFLAFKLLRILLKEALSIPNCIANSLKGVMPFCLR